LVVVAAGCKNSGRACPCALRALCCCYVICPLLNKHCSAFKSSFFVVTASKFHQQDCRKTDLLGASMAILQHNWTGRLAVHASYTNQALVFPQPVKGVNSSKTHGKGAWLKAASHARLRIHASSDMQLCTLSLHVQDHVLLQRPLADAQLKLRVLPCQQQHTSILLLTPLQQVWMYCLQPYMVLSMCYIAHHPAVASMISCNCRLSFCVEVNILFETSVESDACMASCYCKCIVSFYEG